MDWCLLSIMQWLCNTWNIGYILVPLQRKKLKRNFSLWSDWKSGEKSGQGCECSDGALAGNMMEITQLLLLLLFLLPPFFSLKTPSPWNFANSLCRVNPQNSPRARLFKWSQIPLGTANPAPPPPHRQGFTVELLPRFLLKYTATAFNRAPEVCWGE